MVSTAVSFYFLKPGDKITDLKIVPQLLIRFDECQRFREAANLLIHSLHHRVRAGFPLIAKSRCLVSM